MRVTITLFVGFANTSLSESTSYRVEGLIVERADRARSTLCCPCIRENGGALARGKVDDPHAAPAAEERARPIGKEIDACASMDAGEGDSLLDALMLDLGARHRKRHITRRFHPAADRRTGTQRRGARFDDTALAPGSDRMLLLRAGEMIGKSLNERFVLGLIPEARAISVTREALGTQAAHLIAVRKQDPRMIALLFVRADKQIVRICRELGLTIEPGGTGVMGLLGDDAAGLFPEFPSHERAWLRVPCAPRETKVLLFCEGRACLSITTDAKGVNIAAASSLAS